MDPNSLVLDISSDEDADGKGVSDDCNWFSELFGEENKESGAVKLVDDGDDDDCVVLDNDPNQQVEVRNDNHNDDSDDVLVVSEKGQVACRDYPHSRHLCIKFPFATTPNQSHCDQCYCYVCDSLAPCVYWGNGTATTDHCHATDKDEFWVLERKNTKYGSKVVQPVTQLPQPAQPQYQISNSALIHTSANLQYPNIPRQFRNNVLTSRTILHPDLASQIVFTARQKYNLGASAHRSVPKRTGLVRVPTTANQNPYRSSVRNRSRQQNYQVNGMLYRSRKSLGSLQLNAVNTTMQPPPRSRTVNPRSLLRQPRVTIHTNPNYMSHVNSNLIPQTMHYHQPHPVPPSPSYTVPAQQSNPVPSKTGVDSPVSDVTPHFLQENEDQGPVVDSGSKDSGLGWSLGQDSATLNNSSLGGGLGDYHYDWAFDDEPIDPGFTDYSSDSTAFIDTGPIFNFH